MGFWSLLEVASMPVIQVLIMSLVGAFLASDRCKLFPIEARNTMNKVVFVLFAPALMFANLARTVTLEDIISWWFMPVNMGLTFLIGGLLGWIVVKILKPPPYLEGLIIATCSSGNMGNLPIILVPAICDEDKNPFGNRSVCRTVGLSYASFSMALGGFYIWTYTFRLIKGSAMKIQAMEESEKAAIKSSNNNDLEADHKTHLLNAPEDKLVKKGVHFLHEILEELLAPPTLGAIIGFIFGAVSWLRNLIIGDDAPLRIIQTTAKLLGDGTIPCMTIILGGNLIQGLRSSAVKPAVVIGIVCVRYIILPIIGIGIVLTAASLGLLPEDPLFQYVLMLQFTLPPAMNIGTMTQLYNVAQDECSVLMLWTYLVAILALTVWSTIFLHLLV
ncbi:PREDICTED: protein PIN-LIKES 5-like [Camelina sativa]|uniref:Protein PIN-LIKES 5-like n=1 Tax=Camelina sativa TaxID=90675 RepID=A0ABM0ZFB3_CAMSA|nr:PREDICTED: protein PIN-LIKES 5-like [Camelina sativa]XP_010514959.1 PREDICTED: protein PIN-LIKES 5-like [Camelina sativa]XP_010514966.1 PREDICTED: protein PIN-LIKES 5-like [Camelina sativa]